jgi:prophage regulatory protein
MNDYYRTAKNVPIKKAIRLPRVCELTGASRATIWRWVQNDPTFPRRFRLSAGIVCWSEDEILNWIEAKMAQREGH